MDIECRFCRGTFYETTDQYRPGAVAHGAMFRLKQKYVDNGWMGFPEQPHVTGEALDCPECGNGMAHHITGRVDVPGWLDEQMDKLVAEYDPDVPVSAVVHEPGKSPCEVCGEMISSRGMKNHVRFKHPEHFA